MNIYEISDTLSVVFFVAAVAVVAYLAVTPGESYDSKCRRLGGLVERVYHAENCRGPNNQLIDMDQP